jgi:hypothetical protein
MSFGQARNNSEWRVACLVSRRSACVCCGLGPEKGTGSQPASPCVCVLCAPSLSALRTHTQCDLGGVNYMLAAEDKMKTTLKIFRGRGGACELTTKRHDIFLV